jgi:hypothetical protein
MALRKLIMCKKAPSQNYFYLQTKNKKKMVSRSEILQEKNPIDKGHLVSIILIG